MADANPTALPSADPKVLARFMAKVEITDGCWLWLASKGTQRYGHFSWHGRACFPHRAAFQLFRGPIPEGMNVLHSCDVTKCVNPSHLWLGTHLDNMRDRSAKGRCNPPSGARNGAYLHPERVERGEKRYNAKLTEGRVREARRLYASGLTQREIGELFGVSQVLISGVVRRKGWKHIP